MNAFHSSPVAFVCVTVVTLLGHNGSGPGVSCLCGVSVGDLFLPLAIIDGLLLPPILDV
jgi:hypothetical protein